MLNNRDKSTISYVTESELLEENRARLRQYGGAYMRWECASCAFMVRYYLSSAERFNVRSTEEARSWTDIPVEYKTVFLINCHLYQPNPNDVPGRRPGLTGNHLGKGALPKLQKYGCEFCFAQGKTLSGGVTIFATSRELVQHIAEKHRKVLPPGPLLQKMNAAVKGKCAEGVTRWYINFT